MESKIGDFYVQLNVDGTISVSKATKVVEEAGKEMETAMKKVDNVSRKTKSTLSVFGQETQKIFKDIQKTVLIGSGVLVGLGLSFTKLAMSVISDVSSLQKFNTETGLSVDLLQQWQQAVKQTDFSANIDQVTSSITNLQNKLAQMEMGTLAPEQMQTFMRLQINPMGKNAFMVLDELREKIGNLTNAQATNLLKDLGLGSEILPVLRMTKNEFDALAGSKLLSSKQRNDVLALGKSFELLKFNLSEIRQQFVATASPKFLNMLEKVSAWMQEHRDDITKFGEKATEVFESLANAFVRVGSAISTVFEPLKKIWNALPQPLRAALSLGGMLLLPGGKLVAGVAVAEDVIIGKETLKRNPTTGLFEDESTLGMAAQLTNLGEIINQDLNLNNLDDDGLGILSNFVKSRAENKQNSSKNVTINQVFNIKSTNAKETGKEVASITKNTMNNSEIESASVLMNN